MRAQTLAYQAPADDMRSALGPLRALAHRHNLPLTSVEKIADQDALAAVLAAHAWSSATYTDITQTVLNAQGCSQHETNALANILLRAAGVCAGAVVVECEGDISRHWISQDELVKCMREAQGIAAGLGMVHVLPQAAALAASDLAGSGQLRQLSPRILPWYQAYTILESRQ